MWMTALEQLIILRFKEVQRAKKVISPYSRKRVSLVDDKGAQDRSGRPFDPTIHAVDSQDRPVLTKDGYLRQLRAHEEGRPDLQLKLRMRLPPVRKEPDRTRFPANRPEYRFISRELGISKFSLQAYVNRYRQPGRENAYKLEKWSGLPVKHLLSGWDPAHLTAFRSFNELIKAIESGAVNTARKEDVPHTRESARPRWVNGGELNRLKKAAPKGYVADHIVPIRAKMDSITPYEACGLDVPWNIQYLPRPDNDRKGDLFDWTHDAVCDGHDDLKVLTRLGEKAEETLYANGITSFYRLALTSADEIKQAFRSRHASPMSRTATPSMQLVSTWIEEARMKCPYAVSLTEI